VEVDFDDFDLFRLVFFTWPEVAWKSPSRGNNVLVFISELS